jgi:hypothetical protein
MIVLLLLRRMSPRARHITGWILIGLGVLVAAATPIVQYNLYFHGAILATCGIIFLKANPKPRARKRAAARKTDNAAPQEVSGVA